MRAPTEEEMRAEAYREQRRRQKIAIKDRRLRLKGNRGARRELQRDWQPVISGPCGDTSYPENRK